MTSTLETALGLPRRDQGFQPQSGVRRRHEWYEPNARREMESALATIRRSTWSRPQRSGAHGAYLAAKAAGARRNAVIGIDALPHEVSLREAGDPGELGIQPAAVRPIDMAASNIFAGKQVPKEVDPRLARSSPKTTWIRGEWLK